MATTATLATLQAAALDLADLTGSSSPVTARLTEYLNQAGAELHDIFVTEFQDYYTTIATISIVANTSEYSLPSDFYKAIKVFELDGSDRYRIKRFEFDEVETFQNDQTANVRELSNSRYRIYGTKIRFLPIPTASGTVELWYAPGPVALSGASDTITVYAPAARWDEFIALSAAIKLRVREESDASQLMVLRDQCRASIVQAAAERDAGEPGRIVDVSGRWA